MVARGRIGYMSKDRDGVMCEVGEADNWRDRKVEVSLG
jgi:hypothetical protein